VNRSWAVTIIGGAIATTLGTLLVNQIGGRSTVPLPVREPSDAPGSRSPTLASSIDPPKAISYQTYLDDLKPVDGKFDSTHDGPLRLDGVSYGHPILMRFSQCYGGGAYFADYDIGRGFGRFRAVFGVSDNSIDSARLQFEILRDGKVALSRILGLGTSAPVDLDVRRVLRLRLAVRWVNWDSDACRGNADASGIWGDARLVS
jgi:NPCBM/NEW2 domain-containing protein